MNSFCVSDNYQMLKSTKLIVCSALSLLISVTTLVAFSRKRLYYNAFLRPNVSVIIPVYNVEDVLEQGLGWVEKQTLKNIEIICINDASTDGSLRILREHAMKDKRIRIVDHNERKGAGACRNEGIEMARAPYISFVDADDILLPYMLEKSFLLLRHHNADILEFGCSKLYTPVVNNVSMYHYNDTLNPVIIDYKEGANPVSLFGINHAVWYKVYSKDLLIKSKIRFPEEITIGEDTAFSFLLNTAIKKCVKDKNLGYLYLRGRKMSVMNVRSYKTQCDSAFYFARTLSDNYYRFKFEGSGNYVASYMLRICVGLLKHRALGKLRCNCSQLVLNEIQNNFLEKYHIVLNDTRAIEYLAQLDQWAKEHCENKTV